MKIRTFFYCLKQSILNLNRRRLFTFASIATVAACVFLFCLFYACLANVRNIALQVESTVGITVFFDEDTTDLQKDELKEKILSQFSVESVNYVSAEEAWEKFKDEYFGDKSEELSEAFAQDNPLAQSDSFEIFLTDISAQKETAQEIALMEHVREVKYADNLVSSLRRANRIISIVSAGVILVLLMVSVFLISNTITVSAQFRRRENEIMKLIGATDFMIRSPFVAEGILIGFTGAAVPLALFYFLYDKAVQTLLEKTVIAGENSVMNTVSILPVNEIFSNLFIAGMVMGVGLGFTVSFLTIRKHLKV